MLDVILDEVCKYLEVNVSDVKSKRKFRKLAVARFYYLYLASLFKEVRCSNDIDYAMSVINKKRATYYNAVKKVENWLTYDKEVIKQLEEIETNIQNRL